MSAEDLVHRLRKRAEIRRQISTRKSVQEGKPDRLADLLEEAAEALAPTTVLKKHLFLDLEDTIITPVLNGWFNTHLINVQKVRSVIQDFAPDEVHVFSFAIWNQFELNAFNLGTREMIERSLGIKFTSVPTVDDVIIPACCAVHGLQPVDFQEMSNFWGKHEAFRLSMRHLFANTAGVEVMLLDDVVLNETFEWPDLKIKGRIVNIDKLEI